jgi:signal peptidase II
VTEETLDPRLAGLTRAVATAGIVVALDQATKQAAVSSLERGGQVKVFFGVDLTNTRNSGVAFGALEGGGLVVGLLIAIALAVLIGYFAANAGMPWLWLPVGLLIGGALGNLADRAREGGVIDFIDPIAWPAFNLADVAIVIGVLSLLYIVEGPRDAGRAARS